MIEIRTLTSRDLYQAACLLAQGMRDNPTHVKVFGRHSHCREQRLYRFLSWVVAYVHTKGRLLGAYAKCELVGVLGMIEPGNCRPSLMDSLRLARAVVVSNPPGGTLLVLRWLANWGRHDPTQPHWHLGPMAVRHACRGQGIGRHLLTHACRQMDAHATMAYLETDMHINVVFYETLGFVASRQEDVLGVPNWFMSRPPSGMQGL